MNWKSYETSSNTPISFIEIPLENNKNNSKNIEVFIPEATNFTQPYYLKEKGTVGMYSVDDQKNIGKPEIIRETKVVFLIEIDGVTIPFERNVVYKFTDDVKGEVYQPLDIVPIVTSSIKDKVYIFSNNKEKTITVKVKAGKENVSGSVKLEVPHNWSVSPKAIAINLKNKGEEQLANFIVTPSKEASEVVLKSIVTVDNIDFDKDKIDINYPHIYKQMVLKS